MKHLPDGAETFDVLILADLLFNHSEHAKLIKTVQITLTKSPEAKAYVFFTPYRPWLLQKDLAFFDLAKKAGFEVEKTFEKVMEKVMFEEDPGVSIGTSVEGFWFMLIKFRTSYFDVRCMGMSLVGQVEEKYSYTGAFCNSLIVMDNLGTRYCVT